MKVIEKKVGTFIIIFVILMIIFISILIIRQYLQYKEAVFNYNGFDVQKIRDKSSEFYRIKIFINENKVPSYVNTIHDPRKLEEIPLEIDKKSLLGKKEIFITIDPYANLTSQTTMAALEINKFIDNPFLFNIPVNSAFTKQYKNDPNQTIKTCNDVTSETGIILLTLGNKTKIYEEKCIIIQGKTESDIIRAADRLALTLIEVIKS